MLVFPTPSSPMTRTLNKYSLHSDTEPPAMLRPTLKRLFSKLEQLLLFRSCRLPVSGAAVDWAGQRAEGQMQHYLHLSPPFSFLIILSSPPPPPAVPLNNHLTSHKTRKREEKLIRFQGSSCCFKHCHSHYFFLGGGLPFTFQSPNVLMWATMTIDTSTIDTRGFLSETPDKLEKCTIKTHSMH